METTSNFFNATKMCQFKAKKLEISDDAMCLENSSKYFKIDNMII